MSYVDTLREDLMSYDSRCSKKENEIGNLIDGIVKMLSALEFISVDQWWHFSEFEYMCKWWLNE